MILLVLLKDGLEYRYSAREAQRHRIGFILQSIEKPSHS